MAVSILIDQKPLYTVLPIGQQVMFSVSEATIVATKFKVKFVAQVHVSNTAINLSNNNDLIGTFKTTPNNAGVGIFDLRTVLETFIKPDNQGSTFGAGSTYKASSQTHPIHLIDKFAVSENSMKHFAVNFFIEYADTATDPVIDFTTLDYTSSVQYKMFNGVIQYDDVLDINQNDFGYDMSDYYMSITAPSTSKSFLTTSPLTHYARVTDYGTLPFLNFIPSTNRVYEMFITYYDSSSSIISTEAVRQGYTNGGWSNAGSYAYINLMYFGAFPGNLENWSSTFAAAVVSGLSYYTVVARNSAGDKISNGHTINILCAEIKGFEGIRLAWLNTWGTWDYYTFNMKSTRSVTTNRTSYTQLGGTWNESTFKIAGYKGGKKNFRVNSTERIKLNTDFVTEEEGVWFEQLINSNEVYVLEGFQTDSASSALNTYVQPTTVTNSSYTRKTIANDRLMQYTFEIEKSKMKRTQAV